MAITSKHFLTEEKRDLTNAVIFTTPTRTPLTTLLMAKGVAKATDTTVTWRERELAGVRSVPVKEGAEAPAHNQGTRRKFDNLTQIIAHTAAVTKTAENIVVQGYDSTLKQDEIDKMYQAKLDLNWYLFNGVKTDEDDTQGRQMAGLLAQTTNKKLAVGALTFEKLVDGMTEMFDAGAEGDKFAVMNSQVAAWVNKLPKIESKDYVLNVTAGDTNVTAEIVVTRIATRFGYLNIMIDNDMPAGEILFFDEKYIELAALFPFTIEALAKTGLASKSLISGEYTVKLLHSKSAMHFKGVTAPVAASEAPAAFAASIAEALVTAIPAAAEPVAEPAVEAKRK